MGIRQGLTLPCLPISNQCWHQEWETTRFLTTNFDLHPFRHKPAKKEIERFRLKRSMYQWPAAGARDGAVSLSRPAMLIAADHSQIGLFGPELKSES